MHCGQVNASPDCFSQGRYPASQSRVGRSSTFLISFQISISYSYFSSNFPNFLTHFWPLCGWLAHTGRSWLHHWFSTNSKKKRSWNLSLIPLSPSLKQSSRKQEVKPATNKPKLFTIQINIVLFWPYTSQERWYNISFSFAMILCTLSLYLINIHAIFLTG